MGTLNLLLEDVTTGGAYSHTLTKLILAQAVTTQQKIFLASADENPTTLLSKLPSTSLIKESNVEDKSSSMKIAWRYQSSVPSAPSSSRDDGFSHNFQLRGNCLDFSLVQQASTWVDLRDSDELVLEFLWREIYQTIQSGNHE